MQNNKRPIPTFRDLLKIAGLSEKAHLLEQELKEKAESAKNAVLLEKKLVEPPQTTDTIQPVPVMHLAEKLQTLTDTLADIISETKTKTETDISEDKPVVIRFGNQTQKPPDKLKKDEQNKSESKDDNASTSPTHHEPE